MKEIIVWQKVEIKRRLHGVLGRFKRNSIMHPWGREFGFQQNHGNMNVTGQGKLAYAFDRSVCFTDLATLRCVCGDLNPPASIYGV